MEIQKHSLACIFRPYTNNAVFDYPRETKLCFPSDRDHSLLSNAQVNISSKERRQVEARILEAMPNDEFSHSRLKSLPKRDLECESSFDCVEMPSDLFDGVMKTVFRLMETDSLSAFKMRSEYLSLLSAITPAQRGQNLSTFADMIALPLFVNLSTIFGSKSDSRTSSSMGPNAKSLSTDIFANPMSGAQRNCALKVSTDPVKHNNTNTDYMYDTVSQDSQSQSPIKNTYQAV